MQAIANDGYNGYNGIHIQAEIKRFYRFIGGSNPFTLYIYIYI